MVGKSVTLRVGDEVLSTRDQEASGTSGTSGVHKSGEAGQPALTRKNTNWQKGLLGDDEEDEPAIDFSRVLRRSPDRDQSSPEHVSTRSYRDLSQNASGPSRTLANLEAKVTSSTSARTGADNSSGATAGSPARRKFKLKTIAKTVAASNRLQVELRESEQQYYGKAFEIFGINSPGFSTDKKSPSLHRPLNFSFGGDQSPGHGRKTFAGGDASESEEEEDFDLGTFKFGVASSPRPKTSETEGTEGIAGDSGPAQLSAQAGSASDVADSQPSAVLGATADSGADITDGKAGNTNAKAAGASESAMRRMNDSKSKDSKHGDAKSSHKQSALGAGSGSSKGSPIVCSCRFRLRCCGLNLLSRRSLSIANSQEHCVTQEFETLNPTSGKPQGRRSGRRY